MLFRSPHLTSPHLTSPYTQALTEAKATIVNLETAIANTTTQRESIKAAAARQLIQRRDMQIHAALDEAIASLKKVCCDI